MSHVSELVDFLEAGGPVDEVLRRIDQFEQEKHRESARIKVGQYLARHRRFDDAMRFLGGAPRDVWHIKWLYKVAPVFHRAGNMEGARNLLLQAMEESSDSNFGIQAEIASAFARCGHRDEQEVALRRMLASTRKADLSANHKSWNILYCASHLAHLGYVDEAAALVESMEDKGVQLHGLAYLCRITKRTDPRLIG